MGNTMSKFTKETSSSSSPSMWLDLLDPITELILERLPLRDYIRFGAVCQKWRSIQRAHRLCHAPGPPPMAHPSPWLFPYYLDKELLDCYSPLERISCRLPLPARAQITRCLASCRGWLLLIHQEDPLAPLFPEHPLLINPVSGAQILLPSLTNDQDNCCKGAMSAPPTDPNCSILLIIRRKILLYRFNDGRADWTAIGTVEERIIFSVFCDGKFYCGTVSLGLYVIDPLVPAPTLHFLEMDHSTVPRQPYFSLVESDGKVLLVAAIYELYRSLVQEYQVFRAVLPEKKWVRMETLGDRVLFFDYGCSLSLLADDVGRKKNCIYCASSFKHGLIAWWVFDLDTREWSNGTPELYGNVEYQDSYCGRWFLPTLDSVYPAKADRI